MRKIIYLMAMFMFWNHMLTMAQSRYFTKTGTISFFSKAPMEDIEALNKLVVSFIDTKTGEMAFSVPMKAFQFRKSLMQEHFNENYVESHKYPKATFKGKVLNIKEVNFSEDKVYKVVIEGLLTIHGVERTIKTNGTLEVKGSQLRGKSTFSVTPQEFNIEIPFLVRDHVAKRIDITVDMLYLPYQEKSL